ncbi:hypothetical protein [uncultured Microscilla sp.]|uniref:hypothetical protein n=1 Tax=uncultured Microscilla sp. TaxID=432653 RepID=UPI0026135BB6|nr:hypothetical protein [uncultured Microscilla sp.]
MKLYVFVISMTLLWGCQQQPANEINPQNNQKLIEVSPIAHLSFAKEPTQAELNKALAKIDEAYLNKRALRALPVGGGTPTLGEKKVILKSKTGGRKHAKTDDRVECTAYYNSYTVRFNMNNLDKDDREMNAIDYFVYVFPVADGIQWDNLSQLEIRNFGTDGWYCKYVQIREQNWKYFRQEAPEAGFVNERTETFIYEGWVQTDGGPDRISRASNNPELLQLRPITE